MKNHVLYLILLSGFISGGCSRTTLSHQKTNESFLRDSVSVGSTVRDEHSRENSTSTEQYCGSSEEKRVVVTFDTEKPPSKETGLPPVKEISFTDTTIYEETKLEQTTDAEKGVKSSQNDSTAVYTEAEKKAENKTEKETNACGGSLGQALLLICLIVFSFYLYDVIRSKWPQIKAIWKKLLRG